MAFRSKDTANPPRCPWEDLWADPEGRITGLEEIISPTEEEEALATEVWGHMRHLAGNAELGDPTPYLQKYQGSSQYKTDYRPITDKHSSSWFYVEHHGSYWEVSWGSKEFSSSFSTTGRGRTLAEAMKAAEENQ